MLAAAIWLAAAVLPGHFRQAEAIGSFAAKVRAANLALLFGVSHRPDYVFVLTFSDRKLGLDSAAAHWGFLHERGLGVFSDPRRDLMGRVLDEAFSSADPDLCRGEVIRADRVPTRYGPALRLRGWAWDIAAGRPPSYLLATDARRSIVGLGTPLRRKLGPLRWREDERPAWHGYARVRSDSFDVWALLESGEVCQIARARRWPDSSRPAQGSSDGRHGSPETSSFSNRRSKLQDAATHTTRAASAEPIAQAHAPRRRSHASSVSLA